jgi:hypothetical protein
VGDLIDGVCSTADPSRTTRQVHGDHGAAMARVRSIRSALHGMNDSRDAIISGDKYRHPFGRTGDDGHPR